jgi:hypothetical protein
MTRMAAAIGEGPTGLMAGEALRAGGLARDRV